MRSMDETPQNLCHTSSRCRRLHPMTQWTQNSHIKHLWTIVRFFREVERSSELNIVKKWHIQFNGIRVPKISNSVQQKLRWISGLKHSNKKTISIFRPKESDIVLFDVVELFKLFSPSFLSKACSHGDILFAQRPTQRPPKCREQPGHPPTTDISPKRTSKSTNFIRDEHIQSTATPCTTTTRIPRKHWLTCTSKYDKIAELLPSPKLKSNACEISSILQCKGILSGV